MLKPPIPILICAVALAGLISSQARVVHGRVHPVALRSPSAVKATIPGPSYGLFLCQVGMDPSGAVCYDPYQMRHAYGVDTLIGAGFTGKGKTIVIVDAYQSPNIVAQLNMWNSFYGLPSLNGLGAPPSPGLGTFTQIAPDGLTPFNAADATQSGWAQEISLDVLWAHAMAPGANITLILAKSSSDADIVSAEKYAVDRGLGQIVSQSFGENESCTAPSDLAGYDQVFTTATLFNITLFASSADTGAAQQTCDGTSWVKAASFPASHPLVTGVGGTELHAAKYCLTALSCNPATQPAAGTWQSEIAWNEPAFGATGGGYSVLYSEPSWQQSAIHGGKQRGVPDVAYNAAVEHGVLTYLDIPGIPVGFYLFGGTSAGSPQWAAILAIADQKAGKNLGFINSALYHIGQAPPHASASYRDVTSGNNSVVEPDASNNPVSITGFNAGPGWDATTGLGTPIANQLVDQLNQFVAPGDGVAAILDLLHLEAKSAPKPGRMRPH